MTGCDEKAIIASCRSLDCPQSYSWYRSSHRQADKQICAEQTTHWLPRASHRDKFVSAFGDSLSGDAGGAMS